MLFEPQCINGQTPATVETQLDLWRLCRQKATLPLYRAADRGVRTTTA